MQYCINLGNQSKYSRSTLRMNVHVHRVRNILKPREELECLLTFIQTNMLIRNYWKRAIIVYMIYFTVLLVIWVALNLRVEAKLGISKVNKVNKVNKDNKVIFNIVTKACKLRKLYLSFSFIRLLYFSKLVFCKYFDRTVGHFY